MPERSLAEFAERIAAIETSEPIAYPADVRLGPGFDGHAQLHMFRRRDHTVGVNRYDAAGVILHGGYMTLLKGADPVSETNYMVHPAEWESLVREPSRDAVTDVAGDARTVIGSNRNYLNYYHWIAQAAPAIDTCLRASTDRPLTLALREGTGRLHRDTLRLLGLGDIPLMTVSEHARYHLPHVRYADFLNGGTAFEISRGAAQTWRRMAAAVPDLPTGHDVIYVARTDSANRRIVNEPALIELMREHGVSVVAASDLTLAQQINLFRNASVVIGGHGAGLTNIAFCKPGALVWEFVQHGYPNACFNVIAQGMGLVYQADMFMEDEGAADVHAATWEIPLDAVRARLREIPLLAKGAPARTWPRPAPRPERLHGWPSDAEARLERAGTPPRVGIGIVTRNRAETLMRTVESVRRFTLGTYDLVVADDGSDDGSPERLRAAGVPVIAGPRMGVAWNKNRALFHLALVKACDVVILLEDDTRPSEHDWQQRWVSAALRWGHVNIAGEWFNDSFVGGAGTAEDPVMSTDVSAQCGAFTREALSFGGFMDPRFRGYGFEHVEHTRRLIRHGFGGEQTVTDGFARPLFRLIAGGLEVEHGPSSGTPADIERNQALCEQLLRDGRYRAPWSDEAEMAQFRAELAGAAPGQSGSP